MGSLPNYNENVFSLLFFSIFSFFLRLPFVDLQQNVLLQIHAALILLFMIETKRKKQNKNDEELTSRIQCMCITYDSIFFYFMCSRESTI